MQNVRKYIQGFLLGVCLVAIAQTATAGDADALTKVLSKIDAKVCTAPKDLAQYYTKDMVIMFDDKRIMLDAGFKDYEAMMADLVGLKCVPSTARS